MHVDRHRRESLLRVGVLALLVLGLAACGGAESTSQPGGTTSSAPTENGLSPLRNSPA